MKNLNITVLFTALVIITTSATAIDIINPETAYEKVDLKAYKNQAIEIVRNGLANQDLAVKMNAIEVVANTKSKELLPLVLNMTKSTSVITRFSAAVAMGDAEYTAANYQLKTMIEDPDENVRMAAAYALIKMGDTDSGLEAHILKGFKASTDTTIKANAAMLLGKLGDKRALTPLWDILKDVTADDKVQLQAVESIAMLQDKNIYQKLWALLISKYVDDRIIGVRSMGALGNLDAKNAIVTMLNDDIDDVKLCAAYELGKLNNKTGEAEVMDFLSQNSERLSSLEQSPASHLAIMAIGSINSTRLNRYLPKLLENRQKDLQLAAAQSLLLNVR